MKVTIGAYHDFCSYWCDPATGEETLEIEGRPVNDPKAKEAFGRQVFGSFYDLVRKPDARE